jgi:UbiA prenyltransferase family
MSGTLLSAHGTLHDRLWTYQAERFPLGKTAVLLAVFTAASINASALLAGRPLPDAWAYALALGVTLVIFFQLRACDEVKDLEDDRRYRPERPIPRGLVSLQLIVGLAVAFGLVAAIATAGRQLALLLPLMIVWAWLSLMTVEFFAPAWLKARPFLYLMSHMVIMPLIDLFVTAIEWMRHASAPPPGLWLFLAMSFANGCVLEIGRKLWSPENEREGVETYSALYGTERAAFIWISWLTLAFALLCGVALAMGSPPLGSPTLPIGLGLVAYFAALWCLFSYQRDPSPSAQRRIDTMSGLWVFACYALAGFAPLLARLPS